MASRLKLQEELEEVLGSENVYFQPPETVKLKYDAIIYSMSNIRLDYADDTSYKRHKNYDILVISRNPDNDIAERLLDNFQWIRFDRRYVSDNLYHDALSLYY